MREQEPVMIKVERETREMLREAAHQEQRTMMAQLKIILAEWLNKRHEKSEN